MIKSKSYQLKKLRPYYEEAQTYNVTLPFKWESTPLATDGYEYCIDSSAQDDNPDTDDCNGGWIYVDGTSAVWKNKTAGIYYWQVRAINGEEKIEANDGEWWMFELLSRKDSNKINIFKISPIDGALNQPIDGFDLTWKTSAKSKPTFEYCFFPVDDTDTTPIKDDDICSYPMDGTDPWEETNSTVANISNLDPATTYYWQVRVDIGESYLYADNSTYWAFTTLPE